MVSLSLATELIVIEYNTACNYTIRVHAAFHNYNFLWSVLYMYRYLATMCSNNYYNTVEPLIKKGTTSLQRTLPIFPKAYIQYISTSGKENSFPTRDKMSGPKVSFTQRSTVHLENLFRSICL